MKTKKGGTEKQRKKGGGEEEVDCIHTYVLAVTRDTHMCVTTYTHMYIKAHI